MAASMQKPSAAPAAATARAATARERIDETAYELFSRRGVRAVGVDEVVARSGVAKMTLYRHYPSKDHLVLAFLRRREELWTRGWLQAEVERRSDVPGERLLAIFEVFDKWFRRADFEGCSFINVLLEIEERDHPVHVATVEHLATIRVFLRQLAESAGVADPDGFARQWHILMKGSIVAAGEGDKNAALRAREIGRLLLAHGGVALKPPPQSAKGAKIAGRPSRAKSR
jgi:AcrR family transcriptional regulator